MNGCPTTQSSESMGVALEQSALVDAVVEDVELDFEVLCRPDLSVDAVFAVPVVAEVAVQMLEVDGV